MEKKTGLGKGLSALISQSSFDGKIVEGYISNLSIERIIPNRFQPRIEILPESLVELADSIRVHGIIEPLLVTKTDSDKYELIAGERRWRAAKLAGLDTVAVVVREASPREMLELAIVENIQRKDLNPLEEALAFLHLEQSFSLTHDEVAQKVGLSRSAVSNKIRLLALPDEIKKGVLENKITEGHARALLGLVSAEMFVPTYKIIIRDNLSVRAVEELVRRLNKGKKNRIGRKERQIDEFTVEIENNLKNKFGESVTLHRSQMGGRIIIPFTTQDEFDLLLKKLL